MNTVLLHTQILKKFLEFKKPEGLQVSNWNLYRAERIQSLTYLPFFKIRFNNILPTMPRSIRW